MKLQGEKNQMEQKKIGDIRAQLKEMPDGQLTSFIKEYAQDSRNGVQALVVQAKKRLGKLEKEMQRIENLKQYDFLLIHKSYLINYRFVKIMSYDHVVLVDGTQIPISQAKREQIRKEFMKIEGR